MYKSVTPEQPEPVFLDSVGVAADERAVVALAHSSDSRCGRSHVDLRNPGISAQENAPYFGARGPVSSFGTVFASCSNTGSS
jgi:hypothetical protein